MTTSWTKPAQPTCRPGFSFLTPFYVDLNEIVTTLMRDRDSTEYLFIPEP